MRKAYFGSALSVFLLTVWILVILGPATARPSFDCSTKITPTEVVICGSDELSQLDAQTNAIYLGLKARLNGQAEQAFSREHRGWLRARAAVCGLSSTGEVSISTALSSRSCLIDVYTKRIRTFITVPSVNCSAPDDAFDKIICADPDLRLLDGGMGVIYHGLLESLSSSDRQAWTAEDKKWYDDRETICNLKGLSAVTPDVALRTSACLGRVYKARIIQLVARMQGGKPDQEPEDAAEARLGMGRPDASMLQKSRQVLNCFHNAVGNITIQGMRDCSGYWVTPRALILCAAETQCPTLGDSNADRAMLNKFLADAGLSRSSNLKLNESQFPRGIEPTSLAACKQSSVSVDALVRCAVLAGASSKYGTIGPCISEKGDAQRATCLIEHASAAPEAKMIACVGQAPPSVDRLLGCFGRDDIKEQARKATECVNAGSSSSAAEGCVTKLLASDQLDLAHCLAEQGSNMARVRCLEGQFPEVAKAHKISDCVVQGSASSATIGCLTPLIGGDAAAVGVCVAKPQRSDAVQCLLSRDPKLAAAGATYSCVSQASGPATALAGCADVLIPGLDDRTRATLSCVAKANGDKGSLVSCAATAALPKDAARLVGCAAESQGGPTAFVICAAAPMVNEEWRIAAECAAQSAGQPYVWAGCAATRLTVREITKCFTGRIGEDCFGPNNTIVKFYTNAFNDLTHGPGENNEVVKALKGLGQIVSGMGKGAAQAWEAVEPHVRITLDDQTAHNVCKNVTFGLAGC